MPAVEPLICVIEISQGSRNKYEYDPDLGAIKLDRFIPASAVFPTDELPALLRREIGHFFAIYKDLDEGRCSEVKGWGGPEEALRLIAEAQERLSRRSR